ncbi:MAG: NUDIX hydrolase [Aeromicrobium sp.]
MSAPTVFAAGGVLWRNDPADPEVALVHRPKYDDWSLPKGKAKIGEHLLVTALREVAEETGYRGRIGPFLITLQYQVSSGGRSANKVVTYWSMRCAGGSFQASEEVDEMKWLSLDKARRRLTSATDRTVLETFISTPRDTELLLLVRHGETVPVSRRSKKRTEGQLLNKAGRDQAESLVPVLERLGATDLLVADIPACVDMLAPFAETTGLPVQRERQLTRAGFEGNEIDVVKRVRDEAASSEVLVVCGDKRVVGGLLSAFGDNSDVQPPEETAIKKGGWWLLHHNDGVVSAFERHEPAA